MDFLKGGNSPSSEALLPVVTQEKIASGTNSTPNNQQRPASISKMAYARRFILVSSLCLLVLLGVASAGSARALRAPCHGASANQVTAGTPEPSSFSALLKSASPSSLHELLHRYFPNQFQDGVWPSEKQAIEAVHQADAPLATSILQLAKREGDNSTSSATEPPTVSSTSVPPVETSSTSTSLESSSSSIEPTTTTPSTTSVPSSTGSPSSSSTPESTSAPSPSGTSSSPSETTLSSTSPSIPESSVSETTSKEPLSSSTGTLPSSTITEHTDTTLTTRTSTVPETTTTSTSQTSKQIIETLTSTSSNGGVVVITRTTYVAPGEETAAPASTTKPPASLQNSAPHRQYGGLIAVMMGAVAMLLLA